MVSATKVSVTIVSTAFVVCAFELKKAMQMRKKDNKYFNTEFLSWLV